MKFYEAIVLQKPIKRPCGIFIDPAHKFELSINDVLAEDWEVVGEMWKEIDYFDSKYRISNFGRIFSLNYNKIMTPKVNHAGYNEITVRENGYQKSRLVHILIVKSFIQKDWNKNLVVNHKDGNKLNNCVSNLEIVSRSYNSKHAFLMGLHTPLKGEDVSNSKLKQDEIIKIREIYKKGDHTHKQIGELFNVTQSNITRILNGDTWRSV